MYIPDKYKIEDAAEIRNFIRENGFGILVSLTHGKLWATHIPMELLYRENGIELIEGHVSKENKQWESFVDNSDVLMIFQGPHAYISSSWYDFEEVPTWNYAAVHVYGKIKISTEAQTLASLKRLVDKYESDSQNPVRIENLSEKTMRQARGVVGFEIEIDDIQAVAKMSQGQNAHNHDNIISQLQKSGHADAAAVAKEMRKCPR